MGTYLEADGAAEERNVVLPGLEFHRRLELEDERSVGRVVLPCQINCPQTLALPADRCRQLKVAEEAANILIDDQVSQ